MAAIAVAAAASKMESRVTPAVISTPKANPEREICAKPISSRAHPQINRSRLSRFPVMVAMIFIESRLLVPISSQHFNRDV
jgi:hypothetical protein